jgi:phosphatidylethanolamine/phosphatidyl-N-methylethanolamine N-methyltransferase
LLLLCEKQQAGSLDTREQTMKMTNQHNLTAYRWWAPVYDVTVNRIFEPGRKRALELLALQPGEKVLIVGVGTGADFPYLPKGVEVTGIDLSPDMLAKARLKLDRCQATVTLLEGDAQSPLVDDGFFDAAILNLILSVIPDGNACLQSALRALKPGGRLVIFDKFLHERTKPSPVRKFFNLFSTFLGTDINRRLSDFMQNCPCTITHDESSIGGGLYRVILLQKDCEYR